MNKVLVLAKRVELAGFGAVIAGHTWIQSCSRDVDGRLLRGVVGAKQNIRWSKDGRTRQEAISLNLRCGVHGENGSQFVDLLMVLYPLVASPLAQYSTCLQRASAQCLGTAPCADPTIMEKFAPWANVDSGDTFDWSRCPRWVDARRPAVVFGCCFQVVHARDVVGSSSLLQPLADETQRLGMQDTAQRSLYPSACLAAQCRRPRPGASCLQGGAPPET